jgi:hypothetical protein
MEVNRQQVADKLRDYLHHRLTLDELVGWAEDVMREGEFAERNFAELRDIVGHLGLADVRAFGLTWEECEQYLNRLGYRVSIEVLEAPEAG